MDDMYCGDTVNVHIEWNTRKGNKRASSIMRSALTWRVIIIEMDIPGIGREIRKWPNSSIFIDFIPTIHQVIAERVWILKSLQSLQSVNEG